MRNRPRIFFRLTHGTLRVFFLADVLQRFLAISLRRRCFASASDKSLLTLAPSADLPSGGACDQLLGRSSAPNPARTGRRTFFRRRTFHAGTCSLSKTPACHG
jgi:hypothetical protein